MASRKLLSKISDFIKSSRKNCEIKLEVVPSLPVPKMGLPIKPQGLKSGGGSLFFNKDYVFSNFIVGKSNELAYSASWPSVKKKKSSLVLILLFIHGPSGLGKTHLLNSIGQNTLKLRPDAKILYLSAERFLNEYVSCHHE